jgi:hypothetical protein
MAEKKKKRVNVKVLDKKKIPYTREIRVVVKGGRIFTFRISRPVLDGRGRLVLQSEDGTVLIITSLSKLALDVEAFFKRIYGLEPIYIYPAFQQTLPSE